MQVLDLLDFVELGLPSASAPPPLNYFKDCNLLAFQKEQVGGVLTFDIDLVAQLLDVKRNELLQDESLNDKVPAMNKEKKQVLEHLFWQNQLRLCRYTQLACLSSWATLVAVMLEDCDMHGIQKTSFVLQALQAILPKLEAYSMEDVESALHLSSLANTLVSHINFDSSTLGSGRSSDLANDRLYQLFRVSLRCVQSPVGNARLREDFYSICLRYLNGMALIEKDPEARRYNTKSIKASGEKLLEVICNDAYSGEGQCKVISLLLLESLAALAAKDNSTYVIDGLSKQNFLVVLIDSIRTIIGDLQNTPLEGFPSVIKAFKAATGFLQRVSQTRYGAGQVLSAGLFQALRECQLFSVDPDLGFGFNDPSSLQMYYDMLLDIMRVVATCVLSRGAQNKQTIDQLRAFLSEYRNIAVAVFKRNAGIGGKAEDSVGDLKQLADIFVLLFTVTDFVEVSFPSLRSANHR